MGLFSKKLTAAQEKELIEFQNALSIARWQCEETLWNMNKQISDLYGICLRALQEDRDLRKEEYLVVTSHKTWTRQPRNYQPSNPPQQQPNWAPLIYLNLPVLLFFVNTKINNLRFLFFYHSFYIA